MQLSRPLHYMLQTDENAGVRSCLETISGWDISASTFRTLVMSSQVRILEARGLGFPWAGRAKSGSGRKVVRFHSSDPKALALAEALGKKTLGLRHSGNETCLSFGLRLSAGRRS